MKIMTKVAIGAGTVAAVAITGVTIVEIKKLTKKCEESIEEVKQIAENSIKRIEMKVDKVVNKEA